MIAFDWDGTIMDSTGLIAECIRGAAVDIGVEPPSMTEAKSIIGLGFLASISGLFPDMGPADRSRFLEAFRARYVPRDHEAPLYEGIEELLISLRHDERFLVVATGKPRHGLERSFAHSGLRAHFHFSRCGDEGHPKPHPDMLLQLMRFTGVEPEETLMIGDTTHDLRLAAAAGASAVAVTYGAHAEAELRAAQGAPALAYVSKVSELRAWLEMNA